MKQPVKSEMSERSRRGISGEVIDELASSPAGFCVRPGGCYGPWNLVLQWTMHPLLEQDRDEVIARAVAKRIGFASSS